MYCLIRRVIGRGKESLEYRDSELVTEVLTIGRGADQGVSLQGSDIEAHHARISKKHNGGLELRASSTAKVEVNGKSTRLALLKPGDEIAIAAHRLTVLPEQPGFEIAIQVEYGATDDEAMVASGAFIKQRARYTWVSKSGLAWILSSVVLLLVFVVPLAGLFSEDVGEVLRDNKYLPSDNFWSTGPLAAAHRTPEIGNDCSVCHQKAFHQVPNRACDSCHEGMNHHVPDNSTYHGSLSDRQCQGCHTEHKEPGQIVRRDQALCNDCHDDANVVEVEEIGFGTVSDFENDHPEFRLTLLELEFRDGETLWQAKKVNPGESPVRERSNLKFDHKKHLDPEGVELVGGRRKIMECADCHVEDAAGALMKPFTMAGECKVCHSLAFDEQAPDREVPHGEVDVVLATLDEYYSKLGLAQNPEVRRSSVRKRALRRPGKDGPGPEPEQVLAWAEKQANMTAEDILERSVCNACHEVERLEDDESTTVRWAVAPVRVNNNWMPDAMFGHRDHATVDCGDCHSASDSEDSGDVLMPGIDSCRKCHGGASSEAKLDSRCVDCHVFHNPAMDRLYTEDGSGEKTNSVIQIEELSSR